MIKQFYFQQFSLALVNKIKWFKVLLYVINNSIKQQLFVCSQLNGQIVLFQAIQYCLSHLFALSLNIKQFYSTHK